MLLVVAEQEVPDSIGALSQLPTSPASSSSSSAHASVVSSKSENEESVKSSWKTADGGPKAATSFRVGAQRDEAAFAEQQQYFSSNNNNNDVDYDSGDQSTELEAPIAPFFGRVLSEVGGSSQMPALVVNAIAYLSEPSEFSFPFFFSLIH
jgi:hypothetical protein